MFNHSVLSLSQICLVFYVDIGVFCIFYNVYLKIIYLKNSQMGDRQCFISSVDYFVFISHLFTLFFTKC